MSMWHDFQFIRPDFLYLLPLVIVVYFLAKNTNSLVSAWEKVCDKTLFKYLTNSTEKKTKNKINFWIVLGFLSAIIALAGPSFRKIERPVVFKENPLMIVLNMSSNMDRVERQVSRFARAKIEITNILQRTNASPTGLIVYTYEPFLISPLAYDSNIIVNLLPAVHKEIMPLDGDKLDRALELAVLRLSKNGFTQGNILVFTPDVPLDFDKSLKEAEKAANKGFSVSVYGLAPREVSKLKELAKAGKGVYSGAQYASSENLIRFLNANGKDVSEDEPLTRIVLEDDGFYLVFVTLICLLVCFRRSIFVFIAFLLLSETAQAGFLFNDNQEGALYFSSKEYGKAAEKFNNETWKAAAYYKAENYPAAIELLQNKKDVTSLYNLGNAYAKGGKITDAIKAYEKVLEKDSNHEDAKFNLEYLKKLLKKQEDQSKQEQQQQQNQNKDNQNNEDGGDGNNNQEEQEEQSEDNENNENNEENTSQSKQDKPEPLDEDEKEPEESSDGESDNENNSQNDKQQEQQEAPALPAKEQEASEYDETVQAREQKFRTIQENVGGLLKAFIREEYAKQRYYE